MADSLKRPIAPHKDMPICLTPSPQAYSREQLMMEAIRRHFRQCGASPSYRELGIAVGIRPQHVGKILAALQATGCLTFERGEARSIVLADRTAMLSDTEIEMAAIARGYTIKRSVMPVLAEAFSVTECGMAAADKFGQLLMRLDEMGE